MATNEEPGAIDGARWTCGHGFVFQVAAQIERQPVRRRISARPICVECFHHDPVEVTLQTSREPCCVTGSVCCTSVGRRTPNAGTGCDRDLEEMVANAIDTLLTHF